MNILVALLMTISTKSLVDEMTDLDRLARPAEHVCRQFSSYDRASQRKEGWFANGDCGNYLRVENGQFVLAEAEGPGAIVRVWSANPAGRLWIVLDGEVVLEEDFAALLSGKVAPFVPPYGEMTSKGGSLYFPFAYAKSMKVACSQGGQYYHVDYRVYPKGTEVETYTAKAIPALPGMAPRACKPTVSEKRLEGPGVVRCLSVRLPGDPAELRAKAIEIVVDGETCVRCPLGDFFGTAPGRRAYDSMPLRIDADGTGHCHFPIPFERSIEVRVDAGITMEVERGASLPWRFHAMWRGSNAYKTRPMSDWPVLHAEGEGRLVGVFLSVRNPVKAWWGEGDEKVVVDGESFPSWFGTGSEDYFGYAWCDPEPFTHPYHNQTRCDGPGNRGQTAVARYHVLDDIPFTKSIRFDLEVWHWAECEIGYSTVAYWYAAPGGKADFPPIEAKDTAIVALPEMARAKGAIEGESLEVVEKTGGIAERQDLGWVDGFSGEAHLWWREAKPGDVLRVRFDSPVEGKRRLVLAMTKAPDYGIVRLSVNGAVIADEVDLWNPAVVPAGESGFADVTLAKGANELRIEITGTNAKANPKNYMFGLDYLRIPE